MTADAAGATPQVHLNLRIRGMAHSATIAINERCKALERGGRRVFKLGLGQSPFPVPEPVVEALRRSAHEKDYLPVRGLEELRHAVAEYHNRADGLNRTGDDVLIGPGSKELMFLLQLVYYGDLVIPSPAWVSYAPQASILGRRVQLLQTRRDDRWMLRPEGLEELCRADPERPRLVILNYPSNPTGGTFSEGDLRAIADVARTYRVVLLSDEIYGELHHRGEHTSIARFYPEGTIISSGLSKWCGAGGWRLGTFVFPRSMRWLLDAMASTASETFTSTSAPIQHAAVRAFQGGDDKLESYLVASRRVLASLGGYIDGRLGAAGVGCHAPEGGFYLFPDFESLRPRLADRGIESSAQLCEAALQATGVAMLPGSEFGRPAGELTCRMAYVDFDGTRALEGIAALAPGEEPGESFIAENCDRMVEAMDRLLGWISDA